MKRRFVAFLICYSIPHFLFGHELNFEPSINTPTEITSPLLEEVEVPVCWAVAATSSSLHLGNWASLQFAKNLGHPLLLGIEVETAGLDPSAKTETRELNLLLAKTNGKALQAQLSSLFPDATIFFLNDLLCISARNYLLTAKEFTVIDTQAPSLEVLIYPLVSAFQLVNAWKDAKLTKVIYVSGIDQKANAEMVKRVGAKNGVIVTLLFTPLLMQGEEKMGKSALSPVNINSKEELTKYVESLSEQELQEAWKLLATGSMPKEKENAKQELLKQLIAVANQVNQTN